METKNNVFITNQEVIQIAEIKHTYEVILNQLIDALVLDLNIEGFVTKEPVSFNDRKNYKLSTFKVGDPWGTLFECGWFKLTGTISNYDSNQKYHLKLDLSGEAALFDDTGTPIKGFTNGSSAFDRKLGLPGKVYYDISHLIQPSGQIELWVEAGANDLFGNLSDGGRILNTQIVLRNDDYLSLYYDMEVLWDALKSIDRQNPHYDRILKGLLQVNYLVIYQNKDWFNKAKAIAQSLFIKTDEKRLKYYAVGHAHMDLAWLWPIRETRRKVGRTLANVFDTLDKHPDFVFGLSQPQMLEWLKEDYPKQFEKLKKYVELGRIELQGGMWVESDTNLAGEEALVRQMLYGVKYYLDNFNFRVKNLWLPDVFGYSGNMPQIIKKSGLDYFMTIKISWNLNNQFPHHTFNWEGIDGTQVLTHMPPEGTYNSAALPSSHYAGMQTYKEIDTVPIALSVFGIGDGGGGPGYEHIQRVDRQNDLAPLPKVTYGRADDFFEALSPYQSKVPTYKGELYLENHQGTYTSQSNLKYMNRLIEHKLKAVETYLVLTHKIGTFKNDLEKIWKEVLLYHFHDILPGTSIKRVYDEALKRYEILLNELDQMIETVEDHHHILFNPLLEKVQFAKKYKDTYLMYMIEPLSSAKPVVKYLMSQESQDVEFQTKDGHIVFDEQSGMIKSIVYKDKEILIKPLGNKLDVYRDLGDAWNIMDHYRQQTPEQFKLVQRNVKHYEEIIEIHQVYQLNESTLKEVVVINKSTNQIDFNHELDWKELGYMLRTSFPLSNQAKETTFDIQFGHIQRKRTNLNDIEKAQFEMAGQQWISIHDHAYGVSLLNDGKYGYYVKDGLLDINLVRSTNYPAVNGDIGQTKYSYSLVLHSNEHQTDQIDHLAMVKNTYFIPVNEEQTLEMFKVNNHNITYATIKASEDSKGTIIRLYNRSDTKQQITLSTTIEYHEVHEVNLVEEFIDKIKSLDLEFNPFEVKTLKFV